MSREPRDAQLRPGDLRVLAVLCLAMFLAVVDFTALAPFLPDVSDDLNTSVPRLGQIVTAMPSSAPVSVWWSGRWRTAMGHGGSSSWA